MDTVHFFSQAFWFAARPGNLLLILLVIGAVASWIRHGTDGRVWLTTLAAILVLITLLPIHSWIAHPLEDRFLPPDPLPEQIDGILVLGGVTQNSIAEQRRVLAISESAERIMVPVQLAFRYPDARLVITGRGEDDQSLTDWFSAIGLDLDRIEFETEARNTFENALFGQQLINPDPDDTWLLVTSASHMPRAVGVFRKVGWTVIPYPVDYRSVEGEPLVDRLDVAGNLVRIGEPLKEWIGLVVYYAMDRTDELFPAPDTLPLQRERSR